jgi:hypothetical protein
MNTDPTANTASYLNYVQQRQAVSKTVGPLTGNGICTLNSLCSTNQFAGSKSNEMFDGYSGVTTTAPTNNWWFNVGIYTPGGSALVSGCDITLVIDIEIEFFEILSASS